MSPDNIRAEDVVHHRAKRTGMIRIWRDSALAAASCRECGRVQPVDNLVANCAATGGRELLCLQCKAIINRARYRRTPA